jgi:hypothetical protein
MMNVVEESNVNPGCKDKFHWKAADKEKSANGVLTKQKGVT